MYPGLLLLIVLLELIFRKIIVKSTDRKFKTYTYDEIEVEVRDGQALFVFENNVLDLTNFMHLHPGNKLINDYVGTDVSPYIYGAFPCLSSLKNIHSDGALNVIGRLSCGTINFPFPIFISLNENMRTWKLIEREKATKVHSIITFSCPDCKVIMFVSGVNQCGTYVTVN